ncbi:hypothetical protein BP6252_14020 [Coleophoma cylindrospora]|uniref:Uncharacterized protein n=1 Tax=Coleophoma cylindrospora TaxID=1849047 RepID=A0A3D8Q4E5_9HELO|nr:hypothetical protein BP6252_14020 [Coleophoma cylindrospora]
MEDTSELKLPSLQSLQSAEQIKLMDVVDSLRACGLSEIVALPQLVVCGDQSSGKSSVLEAISGIPFPREDNTCTRFATEVILRRAAENVISVSIVPGKNRTQSDRDKLLQFRHQLRTRDDFSKLFDKATKAMGLSSAGSSFSNDVLRVEFSGPTQPQLTLVDLPGLIHSATGSQTAEDVKLVHALVSQYLQNPRSIILAVVSAKNDIGNQIILDKARESDLGGLRTLGIITKPDLLGKGSKSEEAFLALARNENVKLALGWHVVKNIDFATNKNQNDSTRDQQEATFFQESNFKYLPAHTTGINFLRTRLSKVLFNQIRTELPRLIEDIQSQILVAKAMAEKLGPSRGEIKQQKSFLISISQSFHTICRDAARGDYDHKFFHADSNPERRLCANIMNMHFDFAKDMRENGMSWLVDDETPSSDRHRTREEAIKQACSLVKRSRGRELPGLPNPLVVGELFRQYSQPWGDLARRHIQNVWHAVNRFIELLLQNLTDDDACENILRFWMHPIMDEKLKSAYCKLDELLEAHKDYPMTTNSHFINKSKSRQPANNETKFEEELNKLLAQPGQKVTADEVNRLLSAIKPKPDLDMDMVAAEEAFDNMNAYYEVWHHLSSHNNPSTRKTTTDILEVAINLFTDNVPSLAIQAPIMREVPKILCPTAVSDMGDDSITRIAGETAEKSLERDATLKRLEILENGARICREYAKQPQAFLHNISELPAVVDHKPEPVRETASVNPASKSKPFPESLPDRGIIENPFTCFSTPSQPNGAGSSGATKAKLSGENKIAPKTPTVGIFGPRLDSSSQESIFGSIPKTHFGDGKPFPGGVGPGIFGGKVKTPSENDRFSFTTTDASSGPSTSGSRKSSSESSFGGFGASAVPKKTIDSGTPNKTFITRPKLTIGSILVPFCQYESITSLEKMEFFQSICAMSEFRTFSYEELRLNDRKQILGVNG